MLLVVPPVDCTILPVEGTKPSRSWAGMHANATVENGRRCKRARRASRTRMWGEDDRFLELALLTLRYCCKRRRSCHPKVTLARVQDLSALESSSLSRLRSKSSELGAVSVNLAQSVLSVACQSVARVEESRIRMDGGGGNTAATNT
jgi:hypothetical protein